MLRRYCPQWLKIDIDYNIQNYNKKIIPVVVDTFQDKFHLHFADIHTAAFRPFELRAKAAIDSAVVSYRTKPLNDKMALKVH